MGVNALIMLPPDVRIDDAAQVIGILAGLPATKRQLSGGSYSCEVIGAKASNSSMPEMAEITVSGSLVDGEQNHYTTWHWEPDCGTGKRLLYPKSTAFWIAVGRKLVDFFGGSVVYNDCGDHKPDYEKRKPRKSNNPSDGKPWHDFQNEMLAIKPLTHSDLEESNQWAAYKMEATT